LDHSEGQKRAPKRDPGPAQIGPYTIIAPIAIGEATRVFLAQKRGALGFHRMAAIKCLRTQYAKDPEWTQLLLDEARLSAGVHHANIVDIIDVGTDDGCYLVMEYIEGADLEMLLLRAGRERHARYVVPPVVDALHGLHAMHTAKDALGESLSMVHQSPCARHILIGIDGTARITDLSQVAARGLIPSTLRSERLKTAYMAPEQLLYPEQIDPRTDVFVMGITLWESLTGERLFEAEVPDLTRRAVLERHIPRPSEVGLRPPRCFDAICARALSRKPEQRHQTAGDMARELRDVALNEALYATTSELGQWVRALAGRALLERRHALGADAPSIEMPLDQLETPKPPSDPAPSEKPNGVRPSRAISVSSPSPGAPAAPAATSAASGAGGSGVAQRAGISAFDAPAPIATEDSRVARAMTVPVAAPPSTMRVPPANYSAAKSTLLGVSPRVLLGEHMPAPMTGPATDAHAASAPTASAVPPRTGFPGTVAHEPAARDRRPTMGSTLPEVARGAQRTMPLTNYGNAVPPVVPREVSPRAGAGARAAAHGFAAPSARPRVRADAHDESFERRVRSGHYDDSLDSLRPASRGAHIDASDWDELPTGGRSLGILSVVLVGIIVVAGVVGFRQWSAESAEPKPAASAPRTAATPRPVEGVASPAIERSQAVDPSAAAASDQENDRARSSAASASAAPKEASPLPKHADEAAAAAAIRAIADAGAANGAAINAGAAKAPSGDSSAPALSRPEPPWKRKVPGPGPSTASPVSPPSRVVTPSPPRPVDRRSDTPGLPSNPYE
jgi:eukaryotic-like serine/threonine-protein kinase